MYSHTRLLAGLGCTVMVFAADTPPRPQVAAAARELGAHFGHGARRVVGQRLNHQGDAAGSVGLVHDVLCEDSVKKRGFFNWAAVNQIISTHKAQRSDYTDHLLALINFELWCRIFLDGNDPT